MTIEARRTTPHQTRRAARGLAAVLVGSLLCLLGVIGLAAPAQAEAYRYWTFWNGSGTSWEFAQKAPDALIPADGSSDGWRFEIAGADATTSRPPRIAPDFAAVCVPPRRHPSSIAWWHHPKPIVSKYWRRLTLNAWTRDCCARSAAIRRRAAPTRSPTPRHPPPHKRRYLSRLRQPPSRRPAWETPSVPRQVRRAPSRGAR